MPCPCESGEPYDRCCGPLHAGQPAQTALALMRSRYCAYVRQDIDYLVATTDESRRTERDRHAAAEWARSVAWLGLSIEDVQAGGVDDDEGAVQFAARFAQAGATEVHRERSRFRRHDGRWYYVDGLRPRDSAAPPAPGRNALCSCGSGKKYKRCHGR